MKNTFKNLAAYPITKQICFGDKSQRKVDLETMMILYNESQTNIETILKEIEEKNSIKNITNAIILPKDIALQLIDKEKEEENEFWKIFHMPTDEKWVLNFHTKSQFEKICQEFKKEGFSYGSGRESIDVLLTSGYEQFGEYKSLMIINYTYFIFIDKVNGPVHNTKVYDYDQLFY